MPKQSGQDLKAVRTAPTRPQPKARSIMHQEVPKGPLVRPMSPGAPKQADQLKPEEKHPSASIDSTQQHF
jgi:hypothetical protein